MAKGFCSTYYVVAVIYLTYFVKLNASSECNEHEFQCHTDLKCIKTELVCNGQKDCLDNSDEENCGDCLAPDWYQCKDSSTCIAHTFVCDGEDHCPDGDDEDNCVDGQIHVHKKCGEFEFTCTDKTCIPLDMICDGRKHCPDGSDETEGCVHAEESCKGFFCKNRKCLESHKWVCDGFDDCGDESDEQGCAWNCNLHDDKFLCKDNDTCITLSKVCDNNPDCADKSDENGFCHDLIRNCSSFACPSESRCHQLPTGPTCICPKGYNYNPITQKCDDIDECQKYGICSQGCTNTPGSYHCTCADKFTIKNDNRTCTASGGEPLLLYTTQKTVVGIYLHSKHMYKVASDLTQVIGVAYDGQNIYWTNIKYQLESIVRSRQDGSKQEILLTSGLEAPEDLALDWLTGNIYFTDNIMRHVAVCTNHGDYCKILVQIDVDQPRGIALYPQKGMMYWTDWGDKPMIASSFMDGSNFKALVTENIHWPNCITLDYPNDRIYWVDAKLSTIENIKSDGFDRRKILVDILKHPYGISVFEDRLYWSDWGTKSIHACDKFSGKNHEVIVKDKTIYAVHIYHSSIQPKIKHACDTNVCSHICLLAGNSSTCACPDDMDLNPDMRTCSKRLKRQKLYLGFRSVIIEMEHQTFGRHRISSEYPLPMSVNKMDYNNINGTIFIADNIHKKISEFNPTTKSINHLVTSNIGNISALAFDHLSHNLYWADSEHHTIEVLSLQNNKRALIHFFSGHEKPVGLAIKPEFGLLYIAIQSPNGSHIDTMNSHGRGHQYRSFEKNLGKDEIQLFASTEPHVLFWLDKDYGKIEFTPYENLLRQPFRSRLSHPVSLTVIDDDVLWSVRNSQSIFWTHKSNLGTTKKFDLEKSIDHMGNDYEINLLASKPIIALDDHICLTKNGGCSHICIAMGKFASACICPPGLVFKDHSNKTCIEAIDCEFRCTSGECITLSRKCNGNRDCADGSDEHECESKEKEQKICRYDQFRCHDGTECIENRERCDKIFDCEDKSDEKDCEHFDFKTKCRTNQFRCANGHCVDITAICDGYDDCNDGSDEKNCSKSESGEQKKCNKNQFQCVVGTCIPKNWECDGHTDCPDNSDEHDKCAHKPCPEGSIQCRSGHCIDSKLLCDGNNDCGDNFDESNCESDKKQIVCGEEVDGFGDPKKFQCTSNLSICLDISAKCNGTAECPRGEDEVDCSGCSIHEFQCTGTKKCIRKEWLCDNAKDCEDGSDEIGCNEYNTTYIHHHYSTCHDGMFDCKDDTCIEQSKVCDTTPDCKSGVDEGPLCKTACDKSTCDHICTPTPYGAVCSCTSGYQLNRDKKTCSDIDECKDAKSPCAQICENFHGTYRCSCHPEFMLRTDKISCKSIESEKYVLFSSFDQARLMSENPVAMKLAWSTNDSKLEGLDVDIANKKAYFTIQDSNSIFQYDLEKPESDFKILSGPGRKKKIAIDWITSNVYVVANIGADSIKVCNFDKKNCARIIKLRPRDSIKALAVDAINRYLFYSVTFFSNFGSPKSIIYKASLDGVKPIPIVSNSYYITSIEVDYYKKVLYFIDAHSKTLQSIPYNFEKSQPKVVIKKDNAIKNPSGLSIYENTAFIVNTGSQEAVRCELYDKNACHAFNLNVYNAEDIVVVGPSRQRLVKNFCEANKCSVLCVQAELGAKCICFDGRHVAPGEECPNSISNEVGAIMEMSGDNVNSSSSNALIVCLIIIGFILCGLFGYIYYRRRNERGNFLVNMHFQNPMVRSNNNPNDVQSQQHHFTRSPSVSTYFRKVEVDGNAFSKIPLCRPIQKLIRPEKFSEISLETPTTQQRKSKISSPVIGSLSRRNIQSTTAMEHTSDEFTSRDVGDFNDDPRTRLIP